MTEAQKSEWLDASGSAIEAGAKVAMLGTVVSRHGGGRVGVEFGLGQRVIVLGKVVDQSKAAGKRALGEANAAAGAMRKQLDACQKEKESFKEQLARVQAEFAAYVKGNQGAAKGG